MEKKAHSVHCIVAPRYINVSVQCIRRYQCHYRDAVEKCWTSEIGQLHVSQVGDALESVDLLLGEAGQVALGVGARRHRAVDEPVQQA